MQPLARVRPLTVPSSGCSWFDELVPDSVDQAITTTAAEPLWRRAVMVLARAQPGGNPSGLIYGMIVASVVITAQLHYDVGLTRVVTVTSLTVIVYWLTHVYCHQ